jgi:hypothetical protein
MSNKTKTFKINIPDEDEFERIKVDDTKVFNPDDLRSDLRSTSLEDELRSLSRKELEFRRDFETTDKEEIKLINKILASKTK